MTIILLSCRHPPAESPRTSAPGACQPRARSATGRRGKGRERDHYRSFPFQTSGISANVSSRALPAVRSLCGRGVCEPDRGSPLSPRCNFHPWQSVSNVGSQEACVGVVCPEQGAGWPRALKKDTVSLMLIKDVMGLPLALTMIHPTHCRQMRRAPRVASRDARATEVHRSSQKHTPRRVVGVRRCLAGRGARLAHLLATQVLAQSVLDVAHGLVGAGLVLRPGGRGQARSAATSTSDRVRARTRTLGCVCGWGGVCRAADSRRCLAGRRRRPRRGPVRSVRERYCGLQPPPPSLPQQTSWRRGGARSRGLQRAATTRPRAPSAPASIVNVSVFSVAIWRVERKPG